MLDTPQKRYLARGLTAAVLGTIIAAAGIWVTNPYLTVAGSFATILGGYLGIGAATPIEPSVGKKP